MTVEDMKNAVCTFVNIAEEYVEPKGFEELDSNGVEILNALSELEQYRAIGTVSEFRELKEKATAKKPYYVYSDEPLCPYCHMILDGCEEHCECGQKLAWSEGKE